MILAAAALVAAAPVHAQDHDPQLWLTAEASGELSPGIELGIGAITRFGDADDGLYEGEYYADVGFDLGGGFSLSVGYARLPAYSRMGVTSIEDRARQAISFPIGEIAGGRLSGRMRIETRLRNDGGDTGFRLRPQLSYVRPFVPDGDTALVITHESFVELNDTDWGQSAGYDRMRNFIGIATPLAERMEIEVGYLNQYGVARGGDAATFDHVASLGLAYSF